MDRGNGRCGEGRGMWPSCAPSIDRELKSPSPSSSSSSSSEEDTDFNLQSLYQDGDQDYVYIAWSHNSRKNQSSPLDSASEEAEVAESVMEVEVPPPPPSFEQENSPPRTSDSPKTDNDNGSEASALQPLQYDDNFPIIPPEVHEVNEASIEIKVEEPDSSTPAVSEMNSKKRFVYVEEDSDNLNASMENASPEQAEVENVPCPTKRSRGRPRGSTKRKRRSAARLAREPTKRRRMKTPPPRRPLLPRACKVVSKFTDAIKNKVVAYINQLKKVNKDDFSPEQDDDSWMTVFIQSAISANSEFTSDDVRIWINHFPDIFTLQAIRKLRQHCKRLREEEDADDEQSDSGDNVKLEHSENPPVDPKVEPDTPDEDENDGNEGYAPVCM